MARESNEVSAASAPEGEAREWLRDSMDTIPLTFRKIYAANFTERDYRNIANVLDEWSAHRSALDAARIAELERLIKKTGEALGMEADVKTLLNADFLAFSAGEHRKQYYEQLENAARIKAEAFEEAADILAVIGATQSGRHNEKAHVGDEYEQCYTCEKIELLKQAAAALRERAKETQ